MTELMPVLSTGKVAWVDGDGARWTTIVAKLTVQLVHGGDAKILAPTALVPFDQLATSREHVAVAAEMFPFTEGAAVFPIGGPLSFAIEPRAGGPTRRWDVRSGQPVGPSMGAPVRKRLAPDSPSRDARGNLIVPPSLAPRYFLAAAEDRWLDELRGDERIRLETHDRTVVGNLPGVGVVVPIQLEPGRERPLALSLDMLIVDGVTARVSLVGRVVIRGDVGETGGSIVQLDRLPADVGDLRPGVKARSGSASSELDPDATNVLPVDAIAALRKLAPPPSASPPAVPAWPSSDETGFVSPDALEELRTKPALPFAGGEPARRSPALVDEATSAVAAIPFERGYQPAKVQPAGDVEETGFASSLLDALRPEAVLPFAPTAPVERRGATGAPSAATPFDAGYRPAAVVPAGEADETLAPLSPGAAASLGREVKSWLADARKPFAEEATVAADEATAGAVAVASVGILLSQPASVPPPRLDPTDVEPRPPAPIEVGPTRVSEPDMLPHSSVAVLSVSPIPPLPSVSVPHRPAPVEVPLPPPVGDVATLDPARAALLARIDAKERLTDAKLAGQDLRGLVLADVWLDGADLSRADLRGVDLRHARLDRAHLDEARLDDANLEGASLEGASLRKAHLGGARLTRASLGAASLESATGAGACFDEVKAARLVLSGASLPGSTWRKAVLTEVLAEKVDLSGADLAGAAFAGARALGATLTGAKLGKADFSRADLAGATLRDVDAAGVDLSGATLEKADLTGVSLRKAQLASAKLGRAKLDDAQLDGARMRQVDLRHASAQRTSFDDASLDGAVLREVRAAGATFQRAILDGTDFERADLAGARFDEADARRASFRMAKLPGASLVRARLGDADLRDADLTGADLTAADTTGARLRGAKLKDAKGAGPELAKK